MSCARMAKPRLSRAPETYRMWRRLLLPAVVITALWVLDDSIDVEGAPRPTSSTEKPAFGILLRCPWTRCVWRVMFVGYHAPTVLPAYVMGGKRDCGQFDYMFDYR